MGLVCEKLNNNNGMEATLLSLGATLMGVSVPEPDGGRTELVLGYGTAEEYRGDKLYFGSTPGRFANRIGGGRFSLDGKEYRLTLNEGRNQLHGGEAGFAKQCWQTVRKDGSVVFSYTSADGESGYPGTLTATTAYSLDDDNGLAIEYTAVSDADTVINLTNHAYFSLGGEQGRILDHCLQVDADSFLVADRELIPTGEIRATAGSAFDFSSPRPIRDAALSDEEAARDAGGVDICFVVKGSGLRRAAVLSDPASGRALEVYTDLPGIQVYTGQGIPEGTKGRGGAAYGPFSGVCLEPQNFPDSPNRPEFPSAVLRAGETFKATIVYRFLF